MNAKQREQAEAVKELREILKPGDTVHTILRHTSRSGMMRVIAPVVLRDGGTLHPTYYVALATGFSANYKHEGVRMDGCGTDMGFQLVYSLSRALFPEGFGERCVHCGHRPETAESAETARSPLYGQCQALERGRAHEFRGRNGDTSGWDRDGGYALAQRWL